MQGGYKFDPWSGTKISQASGQGEKKKGIVNSFYKRINVFLPMLEKFLFLELSTVVYFLCLTICIHKGPLRLKAKM